MRYRIEQIDGRTGLPRPRATFHVWQLGQVEAARRIMQDRIDRKGETNDTVRVTDAYDRTDGPDGTVIEPPAPPGTG